MEFSWAGTILMVVTVVAVTRYLALSFAICDFLAGGDKVYNLDFSGWLELLSKTLLFGVLSAVGVIFSASLFRLG